MCLCGCAELCQLVLAVRAVRGDRVCIVLPLRVFGSFCALRCGNLVPAAGILPKWCMPGVLPTATAYTFPLLLGLLFCGFGLFVGGVGLALLTDLPFPTQRCGCCFVPVRGCICVLNRGGDLCFCGLFLLVLCS